MDPVALGAAASLAAGLATSLGAVPVLFGRGVSRRANDVMLGFAAGVMLAASFFSLIVPALAAANAILPNRWTAAPAVTASLLMGAACIALLNAVVPHEHFVAGRQGSNAAVERVWLFTLAITLHNLPEGMAVGVGFGGNNVARGTSLAVGIGLQNIPEGLAVAAALLSHGYSRGTSFAVACLTGMVEPVTGTLGAYAVSVSQLVLPWAMAFAAGAMIYVISQEIIPETHRHGSQQFATLGLMLGFSIMMLLDVSLA